MLFHCILANERPSFSNLPLMLFLDPQGKFLNKTMIKSVCFLAFNIGLAQKRFFLFSILSQEIMSSWFKKQKDKYTLYYGNAMAKKNVVDVIKPIITAINP